ncbi:hypothetical protein MMUR_08640 [Mycolicibacterium murale]|uniref:Uncharacterized protein n=1 Tax=Mycolicibacterium murale TaxID=182220 RepID=A0A7I9WHF1_9MYCO|nr:hypothetical protein MMUR_08640 [Mycolicibacterium murale]
MVGGDEADLDQIAQEAVRQFGGTDHRGQFGHARILRLSTKHSRAGDEAAGSQGKSVAPSATAMGPYMAGTNPYYQA